MIKGIKLNGFIEMDDAAPADVVDSAVDSYAADVVDLLDNYAADVKVGGADFQALLHTPCSQYAG